MIRMLLATLLIAGTVSLGVAAPVSAQTDISPDDPRLTAAFEAQSRFAQALAAGEDAAAVEAGREALRLATELDLPFGERVEIALDLAAAQEQAGEAAAARETLTALLEEAEGDPALADREVDLLIALMEFERRQGDLDAAVAYAERALARSRDLLGPDHLGSVYVMEALADLREAQGLDEDAEKLRAEAREIEETFTAADVRSGDKVEEPYTLRQVLYGTNRGIEDPESLMRRYGSRDEDLKLGHLTVSIPHTHKIGRLESPAWWSFVSQPNPAKHVMVHEIVELDRDAFIEMAREAVAESDRQQALVFIHGYNVSFYNGARRAAQLAHDLDFPGPAFYYSWPSEGTLLGYFSDGQPEKVAKGGDALRDFLRIVTQETGVEKIHVIAHSMGNRYLLSALEGFEEDDYETVSPKIDDLIFAAPDVGVERFQQLTGMLKKAGQYRTLYRSQKDLALAASRTINQEPRIGQVTKEILTFADVDVVDASAVDTELLGHGYFGDASPILTDLSARILFDAPATARCGVTPLTDMETGQAFRYEPEACDLAVYTDAIRMVRRAGFDFFLAADEAFLKIEEALDEGNAAAAAHWERAATMIEGLADGT